MLHFLRWKVLAILAVVLAGVVFAAPNILPKPWQDMMRAYTGLTPTFAFSAKAVEARIGQAVETARSGALPAPISFISMTTEPGADAAVKQQGL